MKVQYVYSVTVLYSPTPSTGIRKALRIGGGERVVYGPRDVSK